MSLSVEVSYAHCSALAKSHYENFPVGLLVPKEMQRHVHAVYAFARIADDFADEGYSEHDIKASSSGLPQPKTEAERLEALDLWEKQLFAVNDPDVHPIFPAVHDTIAALDLPQSLFTDLLSAFKQDVTKRRYRNFDEVLDYCRRSANPVGRLVLLLHGERTPYLHELSDHICTALQLANFWQDVSVDLRKDRIYLPTEEMASHGISEEDLFTGEITPEYRNLLAFQVNRTQGVFDSGKKLPSLLPWPLNWEIRFTWLGGTTILRKIEELNYDTLTTRPKLSKWNFMGLALRALLAKS